MSIFRFLVYFGVIYGLIYEVFVTRQNDRPPAYAASWLARTEHSSKDAFINARDTGYPFPRWRPQLGAKPTNISINAKLSVEREPVIGQTLIDMRERKPAWEGIGDDRKRAFSEAGNLLELRCLKLRPNIIAALT